MALIHPRADHFESVLALNDADVSHLSAMSRPELERLAELACYFRVAEMDGRLAGFLLAIPAAAPHDSANFLWFKARYSDFVYVDRIVVAAHARRTGLASALYADLEASARASQASFIACEINVRPPNAGSVSFHDRHGFVEVGTQDIANGTKTVSMRIKKLSRS